VSSDGGVGSNGEKILAVAAVDVQQLAPVLTCVMVWRWRGGSAAASRKNGEAVNLGAGVEESSEARCHLENLEARSGFPL